MTCISVMDSTFLSSVGPPPGVEGALAQLLGSNGILRTVTKRPRAETGYDTDVAAPTGEMSAGPTTRVEKCQSRVLPM